MTWWGTGTETVSGTTLSVAGNLLVAASLTKVGYMSLAGGQATRLPSAVPFTDLYGRVCSNPNFGESVNKLCVFQVSGQHYVLRSMIVSADIVGVNGSCISTIPLPDFTVTGGSAGATCLTATGARPGRRRVPRRHVHDQGRLRRRVGHRDPRDQGPAGGHGTVVPDHRATGRR